MKKIRTALLSALVAAALPAFAQQPAYTSPWYIGAGVGRGNLNLSGTDLGLPNAQIGDSATTYTVRGGYRFSPYWALELGYYDLGEYDFSSGGLAGTAKAKSYGISVVGFLPLGEAFDVYGRIGYADSEVKVNASAGGFVGNSKDNQGGATYGVGAHWNVARNWGVFAEWMKNDKIEVDSYLVGIDFKF